VSAPSPLSTPEPWDLVASGYVAENLASFEAMKAELPGSGIGEAPTPLGTAAEITAEMGRAGFSAVEVHEHQVVPGAVTAAEFWRSFARGGAPAVLMRRKMGEERSPRCRAGSSRASSGPSDRGRASLR
jgi:hypothetical protein